jgi:hypothetical protein
MNNDFIWKNTKMFQVNLFQQQVQKNNDIF